MKNNSRSKKTGDNKDGISRKEALTRMGLAAFSVSTMMLLMNRPEKLQAQDTSVNPDNPDTW
jgi:hypothetical protein